MTWQSETLTRNFQKTLLASGCPIAWGIDIPLEHPLFKASQLFALKALVPESSRFKTLELSLDKPLSSQEQTAFTQVLAEFGIKNTHLAGTLEQQLSTIEALV